MFCPNSEITGPTASVHSLHCSLHAPEALRMVAAAPQEVWDWITVAETVGDREALHGDTESLTNVTMSQ